VVPHAAPHADFGCFPDTSGVAISPLGGTIFTANGGANDISVIDLRKAIAGEPGAELARIPVQTGGFGISTSPDGRLVAHASREEARDGKEGNTVSDALRHAQARAVRQHDLDGALTLQGIACTGCSSNPFHGLGPRKG
jgi:hypothetical protein